MARINLNGTRGRDWQQLSDSDTIPPSGNVVISFARLLEIGDSAFGPETSVAVELASADRVEDLAPWLDQIEAVFLTFKVFGDGRAYSQARRLREQFGFSGEIRATGDVLADQALYMKRSGFDVLELADGIVESTVHRALSRYSAFYQPAADRAVPAYQLRNQSNRLRQAS